MKTSVYLWHARHATDKQNFADVRFLHVRVLQRLLTRSDRPFYQVVNETFQLRPAQFEIHVLRPGLVHCEVGQVNVRLNGRRQLDLCFLGSFAESLHRHVVLTDVHTLLHCHTTHTHTSYNRS